MSDLLREPNQPNSVTVVNPATKPVPVTAGKTPYLIYYKQENEIGAVYDQSFMLPAGKKFIIEYINASCQNPYKDRYIKLQLLTKFGALTDVEFGFVLSPVLDNNFPYGLYRSNELTKIAAEQNLNIKISVINPEYPDDGIGDLLVAVSGYVTESY